MMALVRYAVVLLILVGVTTSVAMAGPGQAKVLLPPRPINNYLDAISATPGSHTAAEQNGFIFLLDGAATGWMFEDYLDTGHKWEGQNNAMQALGLFMDNGFNLDAMSKTWQDALKLLDVMDGYITP